MRARTLYVDDRRMNSSTYPLYQLIALGATRIPSDALVATIRPFVKEHAPTSRLSQNCSVANLKDFLFRRQNSAEGSIEGASRIGLPASYRPPGSRRKRHGSFQAIDGKSQRSAFHGLLTEPATGAPTSLLDPSSACRKLPVLTCARYSLWTARGIGSAGTS